MILVTGATGNFGKAAVNFLLQKGMNPNQISVLVRDSNKVSDLKAKGIDVRIGNYDDYSSLLTAFRGIDKLLLVGEDGKKYPYGLKIEKEGKVIFQSIFQYPQ
jgi:NAD(P)H dehydrogenase (quinone)